MKKSLNNLYLILRFSLSRLWYVLEMENDNYAFIDGANLHRGIETLGWHLDYARFRVWLREKYNVAVAYLFIGFIPNQKDLYSVLESAGYSLIFKEVTFGANGTIKGNCDADLVLHAVSGHYEHHYNRAVIVSSDGDYAGLVKFLAERGALEILLSPHKKSSYLLEKSGAKILYLNSQRNKLEFISPVQDL